jgi:hypothetical protein
MWQKQQKQHQQEGQQKTLNNQMKEKPADKQASQKSCMHKILEYVHFVENAK